MQDSLARLDVLVGEWITEAAIRGVPAAQGRSVFEWVLGDAYLAQRTETPLPETPDSLAIIGADPTGDTFTQHYYDARGVTRLYAMTFADDVWQLVRNTPDFSPLSFHQRFTARLADDGAAINGAWENSFDGGTTWEHDFAVTYRRIG